MAASGDRRRHAGPTAAAGRRASAMVVAVLTSTRTIFFFCGAATSALMIMPARCSAFSSTTGHPILRSTALLRRPAAARSLLPTRGSSGSVPPAAAPSAPTPTKRARGPPQLPTTAAAESKSVRHTRLSASSSPCPASSDAADFTSDRGLDRLLSRLTSLFPLYVLSSAILGSVRPSLLTWVNNPPYLIPLMLSLVMMGTGMTLTKSDFTAALKDEPVAVPSGVLCQFGIMPISAALVGRAAFLGTTTPVDPVVAGAAPALFLGLALVGCSPGGTASNLVSLIAGADVALSVLLTAASTVLASAVTPLLVKMLVGSTVAVSGTALCLATARVVLLPVMMGMALNATVPKFSEACSRFTPLASAVLVALICGGVVAQNASTVMGGGAAGSVTASHLLPRVLTSVLALHGLGFAAGYLLPRKLLNFGERTSRTISIETGMQNSALAVVLARSVGADPLASLPGALSATCHSCLGSMLAAYWRYVDGRKARRDDGDREDGAEPKG